MQYLRTSLKTVFFKLPFLFLGLSLSVNILFVYYLIFLQTTTFQVFFSSNNLVYDWISIILTVINSLLFGAAVAMVIFIAQRRKQQSAAGAGNSLFGAVFGAISAGCPVCGAYLLPLLGIAGSLAAFPLQGLEIKILSIILLLYAVGESSKSISGICPVYKGKLVSWDKNGLNLDINRNTLAQTKPAIIIGLSILIIYLLPKLPPSFKFSFANKNSSVVTAVDGIASAGAVDTSALLAQVNPAQGYTIKASFGQIGPKLLSAGAIDLDKFKQVYQRSGQPLSPKQIKILTQGSNDKITIDKDNAYFLINFLWALGLSNKNPILDEGQMTKYGQGQIGSFASTGGWTLGSKTAMKLYSKSRLFVLTPQQQAVVDEAANGTYRPCCGNSTAFPDCNHGMAMLGLFELMAWQNATVDELFEAGKYFNAFWFPQQSLDIATYFKAKEGKDFGQVSPRTVVSKEFSSGGGWSKTRKWLANNNLIEKAPSGGGSCGV